jgi:hypothetical protein
VYCVEAASVESWKTTCRLSPSVYWRCPVPYTSGTPGPRPMLMTSCEPTDGCRPLDPPEPGISDVTPV